MVYWGKQRDKGGERVKIGTLETDAFAALAPMAGVADRTFRALCRRWGAAYTVTELISAKAVVLGDKKSHELLAVTDAERPVGIQLFGSDPATLAEAARAAEAHNPVFIDINMGCPAPKVSASGGGALLMKDPVLAAEIVRQTARAVSCPVTVKMRSGWDADSINAVELAQRCEEAGAAAITIHARTRAQMYAPPADWRIIADVKRAVSVPVIGNGDVVDPESAARLYEETGCDFIMVGRAAMGAPWLFSRINAYIGEGRRLPDPPVSQRMLVLLEQARETVADKGERIAMNEMRKHAAWYMRGLRGAAEFRRRSGTLTTLSDLETLICDVCKENGDYGV